MSYRCVVTGQNIVGKPVRITLKVRKVTYYDDTKTSEGYEILQEGFIQPHLADTIGTPEVIDKGKIVDRRTPPEILAKMRFKERRKNKKHDEDGKIRRSYSHDKEREIVDRIPDWSTEEEN